MGAAASALRHGGRLQLDAGSVKAPFSRQKSRKIATVTKAPAKKSPAARNVVTHLLIPYRRRRCAAGRNPTPHGRTCGAAPTLRAGPNAIGGHRRPRRVTSMLCDRCQRLRLPPSCSPAAETVARLQLARCVWTQRTPPIYSHTRRSALSVTM